MILIVGGYASGKREYVQEALGFSPEQMANAVLNELPVVYNVQEMVESAPENAMNLLEPLCKKAVVICNETGGGIVPMRMTERAGREATGRLCVLLARRAERVVRIVCGLPQILKP